MRILLLEVLGGAFESKENGAFDVYTVMAETKADLEKEYNENFK
ncbi:hypothetical protein [Sphaerochaeta sp. UBA5849]